MKVYGYIRLSVVRDQSPDAPQDSVEVQRQKIAGRAMQDGWTVAEYFEDPDVSGGTALRDRPEGGRLLEALQPGDVVIAARLDRMFRDAADALVTMRDVFKPKGIKLILLDIGNDAVTENGTSKMLFQLLALFAEWERERIATRIKDSKRHLRQDGRYLGGPVPFGFRHVKATRTLEPEPKQQAAIALIQELRTQGLSLRKIAATVKQQLGLTVSAMLVQRVLENGSRKVTGKGVTKRG